jgi:hypothetical protein
MLADAAASALFAGWPDDLVFACAGTTAIYAGVRPTTMDACLCGTFFAILVPPEMFAHTLSTTLEATTTLPPMGAKAISATLGASGALKLVDALAVRFHWNVTGVSGNHSCGKNPIGMAFINGIGMLKVAPLMLGDRIMLMLWNAMNVSLQLSKTKWKMRGRFNCDRLEMNCVFRCCVF